MKDIVKRVEEVVEPIIAQLGLELVQASYGHENGRWILRLMIDGPNGIGLEECQLVSRAVDEPLDAADPIPGSYYLEVSSPGLDRPLAKPEHFARFAGEQVRLRLVEPVEGRRSWQGTLDGFANDRVLLSPNDGEQVALPFHLVRQARLIPQFDA